MEEISQETILQIEDDKRIFCKRRGCRKSPCCSCIVMFFLIADIFTIFAYVIEVTIVVCIKDDQIEKLPEKYKYAVFYLR